MMLNVNLHIVLFQVVQCTLVFLTSLLICRSWRHDHCEARLFRQHGDQEIHMNQIRGPKLEKGQKKLNVKPSYQLLLDHGIWIRIHAVWWLAKEDVALSKFGSKIDGDLVLQSHNSAESYRDDRVAWEIAVTIALHFRQDLKARIKQSPYFGIMVDETIDTSVNQQMIFYIKFLDTKHSTGNWETIVEYLDLTMPKNSTAAGITDAIHAVFRVFELAPRKLVGFRADGCSTMMGPKSGVAYNLLVVRAWWDFIVQLIVFSLQYLMWLERYMNSY